MLFAVWLKKQSGKPLSLLLFIGFTFISLNADAQQVTLSGKNLSFEKVLKEIRNQTGFNFVCKDEWAKDIGPVTMEVNNVSVEEVLRTSLRGKPYIFTIVNKMITIFPAPVRINITGKVLDNNKKPMQGVSVTVKGTQAGTSTNLEGEFLLRDIDAKSTLLFSYVGFEQLTENVNNRHHIIVKMEPENKQLQDAVVYNGFQKIQKRFLTGSVTSLKMDSIMQPGLNTVDKMLEGRVPGLIYMQNSGQAGVAPKLRIRGTSTIMGSREPLWVVDGVVRTEPVKVPADRVNDPDFVNLLGNAISGLNPFDIDQIDVLQDATAAAQYGVRGANGVIVITTKRGKPGPPTVSYSVTGNFTRRPRYSDNSLNMMNSLERVDVSREMMEKHLNLRGAGLEAYEKAMVEYAAGRIDYETFRSQVNKAETVNTDWLKATTRDVFTTNHALSVSGGNATTTYRISMGVINEPGVIKKEAVNNYTGTLNLNLNLRKLKADFTLMMNKGKRRYTPAEIGVLNYAYGTSRAIPLYNEDGSPYFYSTISSSTSGNISTFRDFKAMNILNEMDNAEETNETIEYTGRANLIYEIATGIQWNSTLSYTSGSTEIRTWYGGNTNYIMLMRTNAYDHLTGEYYPGSDPIPFGGQLKQLTNKKQNYSINTQIDFSKQLDRKKEQLLTVMLGTVLNSNGDNQFEQTSRGYYPDRGHTFAEAVDLFKYSTYANWLSNSGFPVITNQKQNSLRTFLSATYILKNRYVLTANTAQEYSNAFGSRSNEKFLPTWAVSGRWNMHDDLLKKASWVDAAALILTYGTQGTMLENQTPHTIIKKGNFNSEYNSFSSTIAFYPNPDLAWQKKHDYGASLEFTLFNRKVNGQIRYFYNKTVDAFLDKRVSVVNGVESYVVNGGSLENQGVELSFNFRLIDNIGSGNRKRFLWRFDPQLGQVLNKLINNNMNSRNVLVDEGSFTYKEFLDGTVPVNGKSINTFYSYRFKTLDPNFGFPVFYGAEPDKAAELVAQYNKLTKEEVYQMVMVESGKREPVIQGGIGNSFSYGNWTLNLNFTYSIGNKMRLMQIVSGDYATFRPSSQQNVRREFLDRWRYPGDEQFTNIPAIQGEQNDPKYVKTGWWNTGHGNFTNRFALDYYQMYDNSDIRVVKADYLKLQHLSLGYRLPSELCKRWYLNGAAVQLSGSNLFTIADKALRGQDPSQSGSASRINLSIRPVYALNIQLNF